MNFLIAMKGTFLFNSLDYNNFYSRNYIHSVRFLLEHFQRYHTSINRNFSASPVSNLCAWSTRTNGKSRFQAATSNVFARLPRLQTTFSGFAFLSTVKSAESRIKNPFFKSTKATHSLWRLFKTDWISICSCLSHVCCCSPCRQHKGASGSCYIAYIWSQSTATSL